MSQNIEISPNSTNAPLPGGQAAAVVLFFQAITLLVVLVVTHWSTFARMVDRWSEDPQYSHGFVVPLFALVVLWSRRDMLKRGEWKPAWIGIALLIIGAAARVLAMQADIEPLDSLSLIPSMFGLALLIGGWDALRWSWPALAFLAFMMPLPFSLETALAMPLRGIATSMSTYALQTLGCPAIAEGNIIFIDENYLGVETPCSGLGMMMTFFALSTALAMIVNAPLRDRLILVASAAPIAVVANVVRITATGIAFHVSGKNSSVAQLIYHDLAGYLILMPLAVAMLWLELRFLQSVIIEGSTSEGTPLPVTTSRRPRITIDALKRV